MLAEASSLSSVLTLFGSIGGSVVTAFLIKRFVRDFDDHKEKTSKNFGDLSREMTTQSKYMYEQALHTSETLNIFEREQAKFYAEIRLIISKNDSLLNANEKALKDIEKITKKAFEALKAIYERTLKNENDIRTIVTKMTEHDIFVKTKKE